MRTIRRSQIDTSEFDTGGQRSDASSGEDSQLHKENCLAQGSEVSLWLGDLALAIGCFAVITAAGQLPLTAPRLLQAISSARIATAAKRSAAQRETKEIQSGDKTPAEKASRTKLHLPTVTTLN
jgi:hypothetical protein